MRDILFHGKSPIENRWIEGLLVQVGKDYSVIRKLGKDGKGYYDYIVYPYTVSQFTGLTDKNGKKIFEGDIIHVNYTISVPAGVGPLLRIVKHSIDYKSVVAFDNCRFCLKKQNGEIFEMHLVPGEVEVIGNIHDNPELLEVTK